MFTGITNGAYNETSTVEELKSSESTVVEEQKMLGRIWLLLKRKTARRARQ